MARRRMISIDVVETDSFLDLPAEAQIAYIFLNLHADDDGLIANAKTVCRLIGVKPADTIKQLEDAGFLLTFDGSDVVAVAHWRLMNYIQSDRYHKTIHQAEWKQIYVDSDRQAPYVKLADSDHVSKPDTSCIQNVSKSLPQVSLGKSKVSLGKSKDSLGSDKDSLGSESESASRGECERGTDNIDLLKNAHGDGKSAYDVLNSLPDDERGQVWAIIVEAHLYNFLDVADENAICRILTLYRKYGTATCIIGFRKTEIAGDVEHPLKYALACMQERKDNGITGTDDLEERELSIPLKAIPDMDFVTRYAAHPQFTDDGPRGFFKLQLAYVVFCHQSGFTSVKNIPPATRKEIEIVLADDPLNFYTTMKDGSHLIGHVALNIQTDIHNTAEEIIEAEKGIEADEIRQDLTSQENRL